MEWTGQVIADTPTVEAEIHIAAPPRRVWELIGDIGLMPTLSSELQSVHWLDGATAPRPGARFAGHNKHRALGEWDTVATVAEYAPDRRFAWDVGDPEAPAARWRLTLCPDGEGTRLTQWAQLGPGESGLTLAIRATPEKEAKIVYVRLRDFEVGIESNLTAIKARLERAN